jgi:hypothetical protein
VTDSVKCMQGKQGFLKGLIVVDDVAYFGMSPPMVRQGRDGPNVNCDIVAVDLLRRKLLFQRKVATRGLLNIISAPQMSVASTYVAQYTAGAPPLPPGLGGHGVHAQGVSGNAAADAMRGMAHQGAEEVQGVPEDKWSSAWLAKEVSKSDIAGAPLVGSSFARTASL